MKNNNVEIQEIFSEISHHMTKGLFFHDSMASLYGFLALEGFKHFHEGQLEKECKERRKFIDFVCENYDFLLDEKNVEEYSVIPADWFSYTRHDVTPSIRKQAVEKSFEQYVEWETETKEFYEQQAKKLFEMGCMLGYDEVLELAEDVQHELRELQKVHLALKSVSFDAQYIQEYQYGFAE